MMKNYSIQKIGLDPDNGHQYGIFEHQTEQVIMHCKDEFQAQIAKTKLNRGGGFDTWTPSFMLKPTPPLYPTKK